MANDTYKNGDLISCFKSRKQEATMARFDRIQQNRINFDVYHLRQDWAYKQKGQSREFLPKQAMAVEQGSNFIRQGLIDIGDWFRVEAAEGMREDAMKVKPSEISILLNKELLKNNIIDVIGDSIKLGFIGSLMICKIHGRQVPKVKYEVKRKFSGATLKKTLVKKEDKVWELKLDLVRQEDWFPDPTGRKLYEIQDIYMDFYEVKALSEGPDAIYDPKVVEQLAGSTYANEGYDKEYFKARETGQNTTPHGARRQVKLSEYWGNIVDESGNLIHENIVMTVANDNFIIQAPTPNPLWHGESPFVVAPIMTVPHGVWGKALMDAPTMLNRAINEMMNLMIDGGMMSVHGIKQIREHWLEDASQVQNGISAGDTLKANSSCPPGATVLERVDTSSVPQDASLVMNLLNQEFYGSSLTNDLRMGVASFRAVKATEVVEASQTINSMFSGMAKQIEANYVSKILEKSWMTIAQHTQELDFESLKALLGSKRAEELKSMSNEDLFAETVLGCKFDVFGISATLNKQKDFAKIQGLLQTVASSPILMEEFVKKYDFGKLLAEIMKSLDIKPGKLEHDEPATVPGNNPDPGAPEQGVPDMQSQIPQAMTGIDKGEMNQQAQAGVPQTSFPASKATPAQ